MLELSRRCQQGRQSRTSALRAETGDRRRQDHRHGHADRVADDQCRAPPGQQDFHPRLSGRRAGLTIKDRLRVLQPNDPDSYYASRELVPGDMLDDVNRAKIVITNYHAFKLRERIELSAGGRSLLQGRSGEELNTLETEGQMIQRVMPDLMGMKNILVLNDEAHHCYREKPRDADDEDLKGDERRRPRRTTRPPGSGFPALKR